MSELVAIGYPDVRTARTARDRILQLQRAELVTVRDAAIVEARTDGRVTLHQMRSTTGLGAVGGALWGGLIGLLFLAPLLGMAVGAAGGAVAGRFTDVGVDDGFMKDVGEFLRPGTAALFLLVEHVAVDRVADELAADGLAGHILRTSLSAEAEQQLRNTVAAARASAH
ncbi:DUF1269 domain-containing protein [Actinocatenispora rupis]